PCGAARRGRGRCPLHALGRRRGPGRRPAAGDPAERRHRARRRADLPPAARSTPLHVLGSRIMSHHLSCRVLACEIEGRTIVTGVDLDVPRGSMVALVGRNGSGKSTLIRSLIGLRPTAAGTAHLDGADLSTLSPRQRATRLAYVGQEEGPPEDLLVG